MKTRVLVLCALQIVALTLASAVGADKEKDKKEGPVYKTPQEVFDTAMSAYKKGDNKTYIQCFSPEAQKEKAGEFAIQGLEQMKRLDGEKIREQSRTENKPLSDALSKHGLTKAATQSIKYDRNDPNVNMRKAQKALVALIKDPAAFDVDYMSAQQQILGKGRMLSMRPTSNKLKKLKVTGDKAEGINAIDRSGREEEMPIYFVKVGESWKIAPKPAPKAPPGFEDKD